MQPAEPQSTPPTSRRSSRARGGQLTRGNAHRLDALQQRADYLSNKLGTKAMSDNARNRFQAELRALMWAIKLAERQLGVSRKDTDHEQEDEAVGDPAKR